MKRGQPAKQGNSRDRGPAPGSNLYRGVDNKAQNVMQRRNEAVSSTIDGTFNFTRLPIHVRHTV